MRKKDLRAARKAAKKAYYQSVQQAKRADRIIVPKHSKIGAAVGRGYAWVAPMRTPEDIAKNQANIVRKGAKLTGIHHSERMERVVRGEVKPTRKKIKSRVQMPKTRLH